jgi:hypothetical protein
MSSVSFSHFEMASNKRALVCCNDDQRFREFVTSVLGDCDREENHGNDKDDGDNDCFSVVITIQSVHKET